MKDQEKFREIVQKALDGGYKREKRYEILKVNYDLSVSFKIPDDVSVFNHYPTIGFEKIIFDHEFAKALWGEAKLEGLAGVLGSKDFLTGVTREHYWQFHIQQLATETDRFKYLEGNV